MSKDLKNMSQIVMDKINHDKIKMYPKIYFVAGSVFALIGLIASMVISVFLVALLRFSMRSHGPMGEYRFNQLVSSFPWWALIIAIIGLALGIKLIRRYDFSYKVNFVVLSIGFVLAIIISGLVIDAAGLDNNLFQGGQGRGVIKRHMQQSYWSF